MSYQLIASWGSPGAGKTTITLALAARLAEKRHDVLILGLDSRCPMLPIYLPLDTSLTARHSLGSLLESSGGVQEAMLKDKLHQHPKSEHIFFAGLCSGELPSVSYRAPDPAAIQNLLDILRASPFQYIIIDCDASPIYEILTLYALQHADIILRTATPDIKGYEFQKAQLAWLSGMPAFRENAHIRIMNQVHSFTPIDAAAEIFGGFDYRLPWTREVIDFMSAGTLLGRFATREGKQFGPQIAALADDIIDMEG